MEWLKKILIEKWLGRALAMLLAMISGALVQNGIDQAIVTGWVNATMELLTAAIPVVVAMILGWLRHKTALETVPPLKQVR